MSPIQDPGLDLGLALVQALEADLEEAVLITPPLTHTVTPPPAPALAPIQYLNALLKTDSVIYRHCALQLNSLL